MIKLKKCPFCGDILEQTLTFLSFNCIGSADRSIAQLAYVHPRNGCILEGFEVVNEKDAEKWNRRVNDV